MTHKNVQSIIEAVALSSVSIDSEVKAAIKKADPVNVISAVIEALDAQNLGALVTAALDFSADPFVAFKEMVSKTWGGDPRDLLLAMADAKFEPLNIGYPDDHAAWAKLFSKRYQAVSKIIAAKRMKVKETVVHLFNTHIDDQQKYLEYISTFAPPEVMKLV